METALQALIEASPYIAVLVWVVWRQDQRIDKLLEGQKWLIEQLMKLHPPQTVEGAAKEKEKADQQ